MYKIIIANVLLVASQDIHERTLASARWTHDGCQLSITKLTGNTLQNGFKATPSSLRYRVGDVREFDIHRWSLRQM